jgi:hypothetical protein
MNVTISIEDQLVERARAIARSQGTSLQGLIRKYLETLTGPKGATAADRLLTLMETHGGHSGGKRIRREDAYEGRL